MYVSAEAAKDMEFSLPIPVTHLIYNKTFSTICEPIGVSCGARQSTTGKIPPCEKKPGTLPVLDFFKVAQKPTPLPFLMLIKCIDCEKTDQEFLETKRKTVNMTEQCQDIVMAEVTTQI
ncbi:hypothetical protein RUM43_006093 [Polyplax serrata]|uniref:Uncharacterized protein n=1 Tax=Polyplax serrata TaxID=468196 RepID=A0AAN8S8Y1_POLSC